MDKEHGRALRINSITRAELLYLKGHHGLIMELNIYHHERTVHIKISCSSQGQLWLDFTIEMRKLEGITGAQNSPADVIRFRKVNSCKPGV